jgi:hypothetical protein
MESGTINAHKPTNHLRGGDPSSSFVRADHIITDEQDEQEGEEHPNSRELYVISSFATSFGTFTCRTDVSTGRPYQDCINTIAAFCQTTGPLFSVWSECHKQIFTVRDNLNSNWVNYVNSCARFAGGDPTSQACKDSTTNIINKEWVFVNATYQIRVPKSITDAIAPVWNT